MIIFLKKESIKLGKAKMWIQEELRGGVAAESDQNTAYGILHEFFIKNTLRFDLDTEIHLFFTWLILQNLDKTKK